MLKAYVCLDVFVSPKVSLNSIVTLYLLHLRLCYGQSEGVYVFIHQ